MYQDADARLNEVLEAEPELPRQYAVYRKLRNDPRVTRVGKILRRSSLDEILQPWTVLKGEMSIVGPRPYDEIELSCMEGKEHIIQSVRPGMTGLWQVSGRSRTSFSERLALDVQYVQKRSLWLDLRIFLRTLPAVLSSDGAY